MGLSKDCATNIMGKYHQRSLFKIQWIYVNLNIRNNGNNGYYKEHKS